MQFYEKIKIWLQEKENKDKLVLAVCFVLVFVVGFGSGRYDRELRREKNHLQNNYTTKASQNPVGQGTATAQTAANVTAPSPVASSTSDCLIKGNISSSGKKIYHVPGGAFYKTVKPEQCFKTESEAVAAGFVKSSR